MPRGPHADELRKAIDSGRTGGKVNHPDPAAAPLGTDDEAAGTPVSGARVEQSMRQEIREPPPKRKPGPAGMIIALLVVAAAVVALWAALQR